MKRTKIGLLVAVLICALGLGVRTDVHAQQSNRVGLVVVHGDGSTVTRCVEFSEAELSGYDILQRSGLAVVTSYSGGLGASICAIDGAGCGAEDCFCQCKGGTCTYWSYWHLDGGAWVYSSLGASASTVHNGDVEGWRWGTGDAPPVIPFDQICALPPTNTPVPTDTPIPATDTPIPPTDTLPPPTPMAWFRLDTNPIGAGDCTFVRWDTSNAAEVYLNGARIEANGSREVCPTAPQEYHLRVVGTADEQTYTLVLGVTGTPVVATTTTATTAVATPATSIPSSPTVTPAPSVSSEAATSPTPSPAPTVTSQPVAVATSPAPSATPSGPTATSLPTVTGTPASQVATQTSSPRGRYVIFAVIAVGLVGLLVFLVQRRR